MGTLPQDTTLLGLFHPENKGIMILRNVGTSLKVGKAQHSRRLLSLGKAFFWVDH
jgi:hypothetical protein